MIRISEHIELEEALRRALLAVEEARAQVLHHAANAQALSDELGAHLGTLSAEEADAIEERLAARASAHRETMREVDAADDRRLQLGDAVDKYAVERGGPPCPELIPICHGRCCTFDFALSSQDLDEGVVAWDRGRPYLIKHGADGHCVHSDPETRFCGVYQHRPTICRTYDCRNDPRIWIDYEARIPAPLDVEDPPAWSTPFNLLDRLRRRDESLAAETAALRRAKPGDG